MGTSFNYRPRQTRQVSTQVFYLIAPSTVVDMLFHGSNGIKIEHKLL